MQRESRREQHQYFDLDYARVVLLKMIAKAKKAICILDIPNNKTKILSEKLFNTLTKKEVLDLTNGFEKEIVS